MDKLKKYWFGLQERERLTLGVGGLLAFLIVFYMAIWRPWHHAIDYMENSIQALRGNLVWMRQQSDMLAAGGEAPASQQVRGANQSLISVIEQTANRQKISQSIQQLTPSADGTEVRVVLEDVNFNLWITWIDALFKQYGVDIKQITAERVEDKPNTAEIRVTFVR